MDTTALPPMHTWLAECNDPLTNNVLSRMRQLPDVVHLAVMPDVHPASDTCVGTALATDRLIYPSAVGGDIGCGMLALAFDAEASQLGRPEVAARLLRLLDGKIPSMRHHRSRTIAFPPSLHGAELSHPALSAHLRTEAHLQLGTLGGGNHFIEFQADSDDQLWLMIHSGSRSLGQVIRAHHIAAARQSPPHSNLPSLDATMAPGKAYLHDAAIACTFADANRRAMATLAIAAVKQILNAEPDIASVISCDHNHVRLETHFGRQLYVHRKGAMPADDRLPGIIPGSMGTQSFHVVGRGHPLALRSASHGAGRRLSRVAARSRFKNADVKHQLRNIWYDPRQLSALREEVPHAYKDIRTVMRAQEDLISITRKLTPILSYKGP